MRVCLVAVFVAAVCSISVPLSQQDKIDILNKHNELRGKIARGEPLEQSVAGNYQPPAANMREMEWSPGIEAKSAEYALQQTYAHSSQSFRTYNDGEYNGYHGENLYWAWTSSMNYGWPIATADAAAFGWITEEEKFYHYQPSTQGDCYGTPVASEQVQCGHYTQAVWATAHLIGCASAYDKGDTQTIIVICQYNGGNFAMNGVFEVYQQGTACSQCPADFSTCNNGLCSRKGASSPVAAPVASPVAYPIASPVAYPSYAPAPASYPAYAPAPSPTKPFTKATSNQAGVTEQTSISTQQLPDGSIKTTTTTVTTTTYADGSVRTQTRTQWAISWPSTSGDSSSEYAWDAGNTANLVGDVDSTGEEVVESRQPPMLENLVVLEGRVCVDSSGRPCNLNQRRLLFGGAAFDCTCN
jgi:hypothetical protein